MCDICKKLSKGLITTDEASRMLVTEVFKGPEDVSDETLIHRLELYDMLHGREEKKAA